MENKGSVKDNFCVYDRLEEWFDKFGWPTQVHRDKFRSRSSMSNEKTEEGWSIVEIERHRSIGGRGYVAGCPMSAYQTYWMRYAVPPEIGDIKELPERLGEFDISIGDLISEDTDVEVFDLYIKPTKDGKYLISEAVSSREQVVSSLDEATEFTLGVGQNFANYFRTTLKELACLPDEEIDKHLSIYKKEWKDTVFSTVKKLWEERDLNDED